LRNSPPSAADCIFHLPPDRAFFGKRLFLKGVSMLARCLLVDFRRIAESEGMSHGLV